MKRGARRARRVLAGAWLGLGLGLAPVVEAQSPSFQRDCAAWIEKKGYSTDYVEQKVGARQPGLASEWQGNLPVAEVAPGDVVLVKLRAPGAAHAAVVEEVRRDAEGAVSDLRLSEWNWGRLTDPRCLVTENFGRLSPSRWIAPEAVAAVWRPGRPQ
jgi:hypothetical protein